MYLVDHFRGHADTLVVGGAGLGLKGFSLGSAGVDSVVDRGDDRCDGWEDSLSDRHNWFGNYDRGFCFGDHCNVLRGCPGNCQKAQKEELWKVENYIFIKMI